MSKEKKFNAKAFAIFLIILCLIILFAIVYFLNGGFKIKNSNVEEYSTEEINIPAKDTKHVSKNEYALEGNNFSKFDLSFLKFENEKVNKIYSPLSIKYAFKMLEEAATGNSKEQISDIVGKYNLTKYKSNSNMAIANSFFVRDSYKDNIKEEYINLLKTNYNANVEFDSFENAKKINEWVKNNTLNLIPELINDSELEGIDFALLNALGIDMEWNHKFLKYDYEDDKNITPIVEYNHAKMENTKYRFGWIADATLWKKKFDNNKEVSSMQVYASLNNYDAVKELGEDKIKDIVYSDFKDWALCKGEYSSNTKDPIFKGDFSEENIKKVFDNWYYNSENGYIASLKENYGRVDYSTDFSIYVDDEVKVFSKDLKEYDGTTLQYIGIMPKKETLDEYINKTTEKNILNLIGKLKELKRENFKDGYLTYIHGYIPKFNFDYELDLQKDLQKMGVTDVFEEGKANLLNMSDNNSAFIAKVKHKANIEFTQDGIKAAAATMAGGAGAGDWYDYFIDMPTEEIDITFDKPYMFLIRDKKTGETWFVGTVYEPLDIKDETEECNIAYEDQE